MITSWSQGIAAEHMEEEILINLRSVVRRHPWWRARARLTRSLLNRLGVRPPARVLDAGCGWGVTMGALERSGYRMVGLDLSRRALAQLDAERPDRELIEADLTQALPADVAPFDAVLALDVIEHLDDDRGAVEQLGRLLHPGGGHMVVSVPANAQLFSEFDRIQGHRRRYDPPHLRAAFARTGLVLDRVFWWGAWMVPLLRRQRSSNRTVIAETPAEAYRAYLHLPPWPGPWLLRLAYALEQPLALAERLNSGTSLFAVARRP
jgi:2-polyprenyl-3-methyl-5-hydroxy-6-metoxy-1,4-benzoquinol methylase